MNQGQRSLLVAGLAQAMRRYRSEQLEDGEVTIRSDMISRAIDDIDDELVTPHAYQYDPQIETLDDIVTDVADTIESEIP